MKIRLRYENEWETLIVDTNELKAWLNISEEPGECEAEVEKRIQDAVDEQYNKPEYNIWHRETRHIDPTPKRKRMDGRRGYIQANDEDDAFNIMDYLCVTTDEHAVIGYEETCQWVRQALGKKQDWADMFIAVRIDGMSIREYANSINTDENNITQKLKRATKKLQQEYKNRQI